MRKISVHPRLDRRESASTPMRLKKFILFIGDILFLYIALALTLIIRYGKFDLMTFQNHLFSFTIIFFVWLLIFYIHNLYELNIAKNNTAFYSALFRAVLINTALAIAFFYFIPQFFQIGISPKTNLFLTILIFVILFWLWRNLFNKIAGSQALNINTAVIGCNSQAIELAKEIQKNPQLGYKLKLILSAQDRSASGGKDTEKIEDVEVRTGLENLKDILVQEKISMAIIAPEVYKSIDVIQNLFECLRHKIDFTNLSTFYEKFTQKVPISTINQIWFLENISQNRKGFYDFSKRIFDFFAALILFVISLPFWPIIALITKIASPGPVFYKQTRIGQQGKSFKVMKFRSMYANDADGGCEKHTGPQMAQENDSRVTKFGKFMRKTRIDELPQLWNIVKGEMSFVGPRAERPEFHQELKKEIPFYQERYLIKPGLSGWAQINYGYSSSIKDNFEKIQYDLYYVKNRSFPLDLGIILKTINTILRGGGR